MGHKYLLDVPDQSWSGLVAAADATGLRVSQLLRRIIECGLREERLNEIEPVYSGRMEAGR